MSERTLSQVLTKLSRAKAAVLLGCSRTTASELARGKVKLSARFLVHAAGRLTLTPAEVYASLREMYPEEFLQARVDAALDGKLRPTELDDDEHEAFLRELERRRSTAASNDDDAESHEPGAACA